MPEALCATAQDPDIFFDQPRLAERRFCRRCPVRVACREYAIAEGMEGTWGATERQRRLVARERGVPVISATFDAYLDGRGK